jgi:hypothetical protein
MSVDDTSDVGEPDTGAVKLGRAMQTLEDTEKLVGICHVKANAVVADKEHVFLPGGVLLDANRNDTRATQPSGRVVDESATVRDRTRNPE